MILRSDKIAIKRLLDLDYYSPRRTKEMNQLLLHLMIIFDSYLNLIPYWKYINWCLHPAFFFREDVSLLYFLITLTIWLFTNFVTLYLQYSHILTSQAFLLSGLGEDIKAFVFPMTEVACFLGVTSHIIQSITALLVFIGILSKEDSRDVVGSSRNIMHSTLFSSGYSGIILITTAISIHSYHHSLFWINFYLVIANIVDYNMKTPNMAQYLRTIPIYYHPTRIRERLTKISMEVNTIYNGRSYGRKSSNFQFGEISNQATAVLMTINYVLEKTLYWPMIRRFDDYFQEDGDRIIALIVIVPSVFLISFYIVEYFHSLRYYDSN